jgi:hypothetical protein
MLHSLAAGCDTAQQQQNREHYSTRNSATADLFGNPSNVHSLHSSRFGSESHSGFVAANSEGEPSYNDWGSLCETSASVPPFGNAGPAALPGESHFGNPVNLADYPQLFGHSASAYLDAYQAEQWVPEMSLHVPTFNPSTTTDYVQEHGPGLWSGAFSSSE